MRARPLLAGAAAVAGTVAVAHWLAYALATAPDPRARQVADAFPLARVAALCVLAVVVAGLVGGGVLWLAAAGVRERQRFALDATVPVAGPSAARLARRALLLLAASATAFATLESYVHWRAGLGFHAVHCLSGPVHANAWPILVGLAVVASAVWEAALHVAAFARRSAAAAALGGLLARHARTAVAGRAPRRGQGLVLVARARPRAPPPARIPA
jgi:hypothetical protein